ncbi:hypothetical protein EYZ11_009321 [Aspergillus tanneri]|uniref:chitinase n=1 Tax=Aspergillus tanneri TaxID=1220188 RepID=A0A4S3JAB7_9EURO|nr:hypothetical protein EYZ11_009321 [Aspergillus tanneri]
MAAQHLYYSFALIDPSNSKITTMKSWDEEFYSQFTALKKRKPSLKTYISVGGWDAGGKVFDMVRFPGTRKGAAVDTKNLVTFLNALKSACDGKYGVTLTLPSSFWYLKGFDIKGMSDAYKALMFLTTEISAGLDLLWRNNIDPSKVVLGLAFYGRSFTLNDPSCNTPGCAFSNNTGLGGASLGGANPGKCTRTSGILSDYEIARVIDNYSPEVMHDAEAGVNWITWNSNQWVSFDDARTLLQKRDLANSLCLGGTMAWAMDMGGPGTLSALSKLDPGAGMAGASPDGSDSGSGDVYIGPEIYEGNNTIHFFPPYTTSLEVAWPTTTVTATLEDGSVTTSTGYSRTVKTTTLTIPPVTTDKIDVWNKNLTSLIDRTSFILQSSILPPPFYITKSPQATGTRAITVPPFPWSTITHPSENPLPTVTFIEGPPAPLCTSGCGHKCHLFCNGICERDCDGGGRDFNDPDDPDPPAKPGCRGHDCHHGKCTGPLCIYVGCKGDHCSRGICTGDKCLVTACSGNDCGSDGHCSGSKCLTSGCVGRDCGGSGRCFGLDCLSFGCVGPACSHSSRTCTGRHCRTVTCSGPKCRFGICEGKGCRSGGREDGDGCDSEQTAPGCTEYVRSFLVRPASTVTTTTSTRCTTITACSAEPTTTTTTLSRNGPMVTQTEGLFPAVANHAKRLSIQKSLLSEFSKWDSMAMSKSTTTKTTEKTTSTITTTSSLPTASEVSYDCKGSGRCKTFRNLRKFCDMAKGFLVDDTLYGTKDSNSDSGTCYTDGKNAGFGCGIFVKGKNCEMTGSQMAAAYDHLHQDTGGGCAKCGSVHFSDGCLLTVNYVSGCQRTNGPLERVPGLEVHESDDLEDSPPSSSLV